MINIVILGGGFAGVRAGLTFKKNIISHNIRVTIIDRNSFHTFTPSLYEVATAEESSRNVRIPYKYIFKKPLEFVEGNVEKIDTAAQKILLDKNRTYQYDYLIFALGSESADFGIQGIKEYGIPLKTLEDAMRIKNALKNAKKVIIGGGGFSGTEIACELVVRKPHLNIILIQGSDVLLKELRNEISKLAKKRLEEGNVYLILGERIKTVTKETVILDGGKAFSYDAFIWTGGVKSNKLMGDIRVDDSLRVKGQQNIFAAGDAISPGIAPKAEEMGEIAAENILRTIRKKSLMVYVYHGMGRIVPLGGHFVTFSMGKFYISGIFAYALQQLIYLRYLLTILPFFQAIKKFIKFEKDLARS